MTRPYSTAVFICRAQPATNAHLFIVKQALEQADHVLIIIGSANQPRTIRNPFSFEERRSMFITSFDAEHLEGRINFDKISDFPYNDSEWVAAVQKIVSYYTSATKPIAIIGNIKNESSYYLNLFPQWEPIQVPDFDEATQEELRDAFFLWGVTNTIRKMLSKQIADIMLDVQMTVAYARLIEEYEHIKQYKLAWKQAPYSPTFVTTDAVVIQSGHVLLIERRATPGKGLWALPGGFLNQDEYITVGMLRELSEETKIKVPTKVLAGSIYAQRVFDHPTRSLRGRTITHAFALELQAGELARVKGSDDAAKAKWFPISKVLEMEEQLFEDHYAIIKWALSESKRLHKSSE